MKIFFFFSKFILMKKIFLVLIIYLISTISAYAEFSFSFEWGDIKKCTSGKPNRVSNPIFNLTSVPEGTVELRFKMKDKDVPNYNHGGGKIKNYSGETTIQPGAFKYKSPCPPDGTHTYEWTITAIGDKKKKLGKAVATRNYPE